MPVSTNARPIQPSSGYGQGAPHQASDPGAAFGGPMPVNLFGTGTPAATEPFSGAGVGSTFSQTDAGAANPNVWVKRADTNAIADWVLPGSTGIVNVRSPDLFDISVADSEQICYNAVGAAEVILAGLLWIEATDADAGTGDITIGVSSGNNDIVNATQFGNSQAAGSYQALTITDGALVAGESIFASHDQSTSEAGTFYVQLLVRVEA